MKAPWTAFGAIAAAIASGMAAFVLPDPWSLLVCLALAALAVVLLVWREAEIENFYLDCMADIERASDDIAKGSAP